MKNRPRTPSLLSLSLSMILAVGALVACGGGEEETSVVAGPSTVTVDLPPVTPTNSANIAGLSANGTLDYLVFGATGTPGVATATTANVGAARNITFLPDPAGPFATGLIISETLGSALPMTWNGAPNHGSVFYFSWPSQRMGWLGEGNFLVYCSAGTASNASSRAGAQVAVSGNFVPMSNIAPLYGKRFDRFDCTNSTSTTFGDRKGNLTMTFDGMTFNQDQVVAAFSTAGYQPTPGVNPSYKRRAYQINTNGKTVYIVVALDVDATGNASAAVLY